ncbi:hypothetical protein QZH41_017591 [Actinostola sp. cb2023]|nr:hypothetical protein QZH41_017591 [Actinostola sp. cb2023]
MGRRRSKRKAEPKKRREPLDVQFNCPFCNHEKSCEVKIDRIKNMLHILSCLPRIISISNYLYPLRIYFLPDLSEPVDVYSDWIDACELANQ